MNLRIAASILLLFVLAGCYRDNEAELDPCRIEPGMVHYRDVTTLFTSYGCYGCHSGTVPEGGISLAQHASVKALVDNGRLMGAINHASGYAAMPQGAPQMDACDISRIQAWIDAGAREH